MLTDDQACINSNCVRPCLYGNPCAANNAECFNRNHQAECRCKSGFFGNPRIACEPEPKPECISDGDCPSQTICYNSKCSDPCRILSPCAAPSVCRVIDTLPVRTITCQCPGMTTRRGARVDWYGTGDQDFKMLLIHRWIRDSERRSLSRPDQARLYERL